MNFTQATEAVGVSQRSGKVWRNGKNRSTGGNEAASVDWYCFHMDKPNPMSSRYLSQDERIIIADMLKHNVSIREISQRLGGAPFRISREVRANTHPDNGSIGTLKSSPNLTSAFETTKDTENSCQPRDVCVS
ncbi:helix-turn-helix domain-containing protein [Arcanobacterium buesumense]|uniref:Helix-turn-helix domain-containing protein n=1 Tax=Arcanobacterium buesumense TaxID=2722751 RepID=A0A6H2ELI9_9ACTO|nr:helix-turn-helix domain-containing protein [Arcanobacterium buesumense]QJC21937.1 helix-turn-helix domain-containing protein [Arcanobacterium buesumense]